jgi:hypothetical protein
MEMDSTVPVDTDRREQSAPAALTSAGVSNIYSDCCPECGKSPPIGELSIFLFGLLATFGVVMAPPLSNFDGYVYRLNGLSPVDSLRGPHLIWIPFQALLWRVFGWFDLSGTVSFQVVGVLFSALACTLLFRLMAEQREQLVPAFVISVFIATSPWVWYLAPVNQPYPPLFLLLVLFLYAWRSAPQRPVALIWLGCIVCLSSLLQMAAIIWAGATGLLLLFFTPGPLRVRLNRAFLWGLGVCSAILAAYALAVALRGMDSVRDIYDWITGHYTELHGPAQDRWANLVKSGFGILGTFVQAQPLQDWLLERYTPDRIMTGLAITEGILLVLGLLPLLLGRVRRWVAGWPWGNPLFMASFFLMVAWSVFCCLWEPINKFWAVCLFPFFQVFIMLCRNAPKWARRGLIAVLTCCIAWNLCTNHQIDLYNAATFPDQQLEILRSSIRPADRLFVLQRNTGDRVDYDLLLECLSIVGWTN